MLQETHSDLSSEKQWQLEWGSEIIFSHGSRTSKGVAILLPVGIPYKLNECEISLDGRYIAANIEVDSEFNFSLINLYAPTQDNTEEQINVLKEVGNVIDQIAGDNLIVGGDL